MRAVVVGGGAPRVETRPDAAPAPGECVVRVTSALVRDDERQVAAGATAPIVPGSAFVGVVDTVALDGEPGRLRDGREWVSRRVAVHPVVRCGRCDRCASGLGALCASRATLGADRDGGLAERVVVPVANLVALPPSLDDESAAFAAPVSEAIELTRHVRVDGKAYVTVLGDGLSALIATQVLSRLNAAVRVVSQRGRIAATAERLGLRHRLAAEVGRRGDQHVVVECDGTGASLELACRLARPRGTILLRAWREARAPGDALSEVVANELRVQGVGLGTLPEALDLLARRGVDTSCLVERRGPLGDAPAALSSHAIGHLASLVRLSA